MGHSRLESLPDTSPWRRVVGFIAGDADVGVVADATMEAAQRGLEIADGDEGLKQTFWLLSQITLAARQDDFSAALKEIGIVVSSEPSVLNIVARFTNAIDQHLLETRRRTDIGELAQFDGHRNKVMWVGLRQSKYFRGAAW